MSEVEPRFTESQWRAKLEAEQLSAARKAQAEALEVAHIAKEEAEQAAKEKQAERPADV